MLAAEPGRERVAGVAASLLAAPPGWERVGVLVVAAPEREALEARGKSTSAGSTTGPSELQAGVRVHTGLEV